MSRMSAQEGDKRQKPGDNTSPTTTTTTRQKMGEHDYLSTKKNLKKNIYNMAEEGCHAESVGSIWTTGVQMKDCQRFRTPVRWPEVQQRGEMDRGSEPL